MPTTNLFRGQAIGAKLERIGEILKLTLDVEDYNRLFPRALVGAPDGVTFLDQDDGTRIPVDVLATNLGPGVEVWGPGDEDVFRYLMQVYWPGPPVGLLTHVHHYRDQSDTVSWMTALSDLKAILDEWASRTSGATRFWVDPDLEAWWFQVAPTEMASVSLDPEQGYAMMFPTFPPEGMLAGPVGLSDTPDGITTIMPMAMSVSWDWAPFARRVYVRGGTVAPEGSGWVYGSGAPPYAGDVYIDAEGSAVASDKEAIGRWHLEQNLRQLLTGSATIAAGTDGWRVGYTVLVTSPIFSQLVGYTLDATPFIIQSVTGRLVGTGPGLGLEVDGVDISSKIASWDQLTFEEVLGQSGKASITLELIEESVTVGPLADVRLFTDGQAEIEYDLAFGDVPPGSLARERAPDPSKQPAVRFIVTVQDPGIEAGERSLVTAQLADAAGAPLAVNGVFFEWVLLQWALAGQSDVAFWTAAVAKMNGYIAVYQGILDRGGTLTARQAAALATDTVTRDYDQMRLDEALAALGSSPLVPGTGYELQDVGGTTDPAGRGTTYLLRDVGDATSFEVDAVALPL
jgi:hypothetical protein